MRRVTLFGFLALGGILLGGSAWAPGGQEGGVLERLRIHGGEVPDPGEVGQDVPSDPVLAELAAGRYWHAARFLRSRRSSDLPDGPEERMLLARAEAGWENWIGVRRLLADGRWRETPDVGRALLLLGRASEELEHWEEAADAYRRHLADGYRVEGVGPEEVRVRLVRARHRAGDRRGAYRELERIGEDRQEVLDWLLLELGEAAADEGEPGEVEELLSRISTPGVRERGWALPGRAHLVAGDTVGAEIAYGVAAEEADDTARRSAAWATVGELRTLRGADSEARRAFLRSLDASTDGGGALRSARALRADRSLGPERILEIAEVLRRGGEDQAALDAYDRHRSVASPEPAVVLTRARLLVSTGREAEAARELRELARVEGGEVAVSALHLLADVLEGQGRTEGAREVERELVDRFPSRREAVEAVVGWGDRARAAGDLPAAVRHYERAGEMAPGTGVSDVARLLRAEVLREEGDRERALTAYEGYLRERDGAPRVDEATYWAARLRWERGDEREARRHLQRLLKEDPFTYYGVLAARMMGEPFEPRISEGSVPRLPPDLASILQRLEALQAVGLRRGAGAQVDEILRQTGEVGEGALLALATALIGKGYPLEGIGLGWELRRRGEPWDRALARVVFPLPGEELVFREAAEQGMNPHLLAAVIRQESAFQPHARSRAGALGLMQIMPATGEELARNDGIEGFSPSHLFRPELNLHLGTAFLKELEARYGGDPALFLAAYNAGPSRANRWRARYGAPDDIHEFTDRIPFPETRNYVRRVTRNVEIYAWLYGEQAGR